MGAVLLSHACRQLSTLLDRLAQSTAALRRRSGQPLAGAWAAAVGQCCHAFIVLVAARLITLPEDAWIRLLSVAGMRGRRFEE